MTSIQATRIRKGMLLQLGQHLFRVLDFQHVTPGKGPGFVRAKFRNIRNSTLSDQKFRSEDLLERVILDSREMQYLYQDGDNYCFMDTETFDQVPISKGTLGDSVNYLRSEMTIQVEFYESEPLGIELPQAMDLKVVDTVSSVESKPR